MQIKIMSEKPSYQELEQRVQELEKAESALKQVEEALRESEEKHRTALEASPDPIVIYNMEGKTVYINPAFTRLFGWTLKELQGEKINYVPKENWPETRKMLDRLNRGESFHGFETRRYNKKGEMLDIRMSFGVWRNKDGNPVGSVVILHDFSEHKKLESQLRNALKMESLGTLAGGIAHDFNNLLMGIQGRSSLMSLDLDPSHPHLEHLNAINEYIQSATDLTNQLLGFARGGKYEVKRININELVLNCATMFGRTRKEINVHTKIEQSPLVIEADRSQIEQVLLNMFVNAWQAMPGGGELYLETKAVFLDDEYCKPYEVKAGKYAKVSVTDTGTGMNEATRRQVFDPFFTTKDKSRGAGLGLASAYGIIKNHGGIITVYSESGHGTTFNIYLQTSEQQAQQEMMTDIEMIKGSETILLVDDEDIIIDVGQAMLKKLGYRVIVSTSGLEAIENITSSGNKIDLVILDLIMPGMNGGKTFDRIREIQPEMPVILSSGYSISGQAKEIMRRGCNAFIQKPFNISELSQKVRNVLFAAMGSSQQ